MNKMNGKKFTLYFIAVIIICGIGTGILMKQAYDTRPQIKIEEAK